MGNLVMLLRLLIKVRAAKSNAERYTFPNRSGLITLHEPPTISQTFSSIISGLCIVTQDYFWTRCSSSFKGRQLSGPGSHARHLTISKCSQKRLLRENLRLAELRLTYSQLLNRSTPSLVTKGKHAAGVLSLGSLKAKNVALFIFYNFILFLIIYLN